MKFFICSLMLCFVCVGCGTKPVYQKGVLGLSDHRRIVILGEHVERIHALYYQQYYQAYVWYIPSQGWMSDATLKMRHVFAVSRGMKKLIAELESLSYTIGDWTIILPLQAQPYFLSTLKNMKDGVIDGAKGKVVLINATENVAMENEVWRVFGGSFDVVYQEGK